MALSTSNKYGQIMISDEVVAIIASRVASECYGVVELVSRFSPKNLHKKIFNKQSYKKGVRVESNDNIANIDIYVILKHGVNVDAVTESLAKSVKYSVGKYTGMRVKSVNVNVVGIKE